MNFSRTLNNSLHCSLCLSQVFARIKEAHDAHKARLNSILVCENTMSPYPTSTWTSSSMRKKSLCEKLIFLFTTTHNPIGKSSIWTFLIWPGFLYNSIMGRIPNQSGLTLSHNQQISSMVRSPTSASSIIDRSLSLPSPSGHLIYYRHSLSPNGTGTWSMW